MEEEKKVEETKEVKTTYKKHGPLYWIIIVVGMTFIVFMSVRMGEKIANKDNDNDGGTTKYCMCDSNGENCKCDTKPIISEKSNKERSNEVTEDTKKALYKKLALLFSDEKKNYGETIVAGDGYNYSFVFDNKLTEEDKSFIIIRTLTNGVNKKINKNSIKFKDAEKNKDIQTNPSLVEEYTTYSTADFSANYKNVFGTEPTFVDIKGCPSFFYDLNSKEYIEFDGCGFAAAKNLYVYPEEYVATSDNTINVVAYAGASLSVADEEYYYKDVYYTEGSASTTTKFTTIDSSNKTTFTKYNFTFEKASDGEYYFKSVTKAN